MFTVRAVVFVSGLSLYNNEVSSDVCMCSAVIGILKHIIYNSIE